METTAEQLIREKGYDALSPEELAVVQELCDSEEEFQSMKQFFGELDQMTGIQQSVVSPAIKESLDSIFAAKHPGIRANWTAPVASEVPQQTKVVPLYQRKWARIAAIFILAMGTVPLWLTIAEKEELSKSSAAQMAKNEVKKEVFSTNGEEKAISGSMNAADEKAADSKAVIVNDLVSAESGAEEAYKSVSYDLTEPVATPELKEVGSLSVATPVLAFDEREFSSSSMGITSHNLTVNGFTNSAMSPGMLADLNPEGRSRFQLNYVPESPLAASLDKQPDELLDLLVPAF